MFLHSIIFVDYLLTLIITVENMASVNVADIIYSESNDCYGSFSYSASIIVIIISCVLGIIWAAINFILVRSIKVDESSS